MPRLSRLEYFMTIADVVSRRGTCDRARVGCILVKEDRIIATGYNGSPSGEPHCDDIGHLMVEGHCVRTIHSEENALRQAELYEVSANGAICYCTLHPCTRCASRLFDAGVRELVYRDMYSTLSEEDAEFIGSLGLFIYKFSDLHKGN